MAEVALTPTAFAAQTLATASSGSIPAAIGAIGAGLGLIALTPVLAPASVPMSVLGMVLARRQNNWLALSLGSLGVALALAALLQSGAFWVVFATVLSSLTLV